MRFLTKVSGKLKLANAIAAFTGIAKQIIATNDWGKVDRTFLPFSWVWSTAINSGNVGSGFLRRQNGTPTNLVPYVSAYPAYIEAISLENRPSEQDDWVLNIFVNGNLAWTFAKPQGQNFKLFPDDGSFSLDLPLERGDAVSLRCVRINNGNISNPGVSLYIRQRFN